MCNHLHIWRMAFLASLNPRSTEAGLTNSANELARSSDRETTNLILSLGPGPQESWAGQIPRPYFHTATRKNFRVEDPASKRALVYGHFGMTRGYQSRITH